MSRLAYEFEDERNPDHQFRCRLRCDQCTFVKPDGNRCRNRVCLGYPICWIHTKQTYGVKTRPSVLGGRGLFATRNFQQGDWIVPYVGEIIDEECVNLRYPGDVTATYVLEDTDARFIDSACQRGTGAIANGRFNRRTGRSAPRNLHDAEIATNDQEEVWLRAIRDIPEGQEILVFYHVDYMVEDNHTTRRTRRPDTRPC